MDEQLLQRIWRAQHFSRADLRTLGGASIAIVYRGRAQRSAGPDFRGAAIVFDGQLRHGDVELHLRATDWDTHHHGRDHHYDDVLLHVVYDAAGARPVRTASGCQVDCLSIGERLGPEADWLEMARPGEDDCRRLVASLTPETLGQRIDRLGDERLIDKAGRLEAEIVATEAEQVYYESLLDALGYSQNREPFGELGRRLSVASLDALTRRRPPAERILLCQSLLLGVAGLLPSQRHQPESANWVEAALIADYEETWLAYGGDWLPEAMSAEVWCLGVRPLNSPVRRIVGLGYLLARQLSMGLLESAGGIVRRDPGRTAVRGLVESLQVATPDAYWAEHWDFGRPLAQPAPLLIGRQRALEIVVNVCLPMLLAVGSGQKERADTYFSLSIMGATEASLPAAIWTTFRAAPRLAPNEVTNWMITEVLGAETAGLIRGARRQQGLHQQFAKACDTRDCQHCRLVRE